MVPWGQLGQVALEHGLEQVALAQMVLGCSAPAQMACVPLGGQLSLAFPLLILLELLETL